MVLLNLLIEKLTALIPNLAELENPALIKMDVIEIDRLMEKDQQHFKTRESLEIAKSGYDFSRSRTLKSLIQNLSDFGMTIDTSGKAKLSSDQLIQFYGNQKYTRK